MLKGLSPLLDGELLRILDLMGHGDDLVLADRNFPAASVAADTVSGQLIRLSGADTVAAASAIFSVFPLDSFVPEPIMHMQVIGEPGTVLPVHRDLHACAERAEGRAVGMGSIERFAFYAAARAAFAVVQTIEDRPYGCFLLRKGVIPA